MLTATTGKMTHQRGPRIAIVGAGPAGLTAAIAAAQAGFRATVFERAEDFARIGGGIVIHSNGLRVLERLGLLERFRPLMVPCHRLALQLADGSEAFSEYGDLPIPHNYFAVVLRHQLQEQLLASLADAVPIRFGYRCIAVNHQDGRARLQFENGETAEFKIVIGADGAHSEVRQSVPVRVVRKAAGDAFLRGVSDCPTDERLVREIWGADGRRFGTAPLTEGRTYFYCSAPPGQWSEIRHQHLDAWIDSWEPYGRRISEVLRHVGNWDEVNYDEPEQIRMTRWYAPPTFLIGDGAHAMMPNYGQGANAAMVDAVVLMTILARSLRSGSSLADVGREYDWVRRQFVNRTQSAAWRLGVAAQWTSPAARSIRDLVIRILSRSRPLSRRQLLLVAGYNPREKQHL